MKHATEQKLRKVYFWVIAALVMISANLAAGALGEIFEKGLDKTSWLTLSYPGWFIIFFALFALQIGPAFRPFTTSLSNELVFPRNHLVLFLSELPFKTEELVENHGMPAWLTLTDDLHEDLCFMAAMKQSDKRCFWRWEMPLRGIKEHLITKDNINKLETVTLLCSRESLTQIELFYKIFRRYTELKRLTFCLLGNRNNIHELITITDPTNFKFLLRDYQGWEFENFNELSMALWNLFQEFKRRNCPDEEIMVDFTGGQKVTSVVAAAMTFNRKIKAQYVQTNEPWEVVSYDIHLGTSQTGGLL